MHHRRDSSPGLEARIFTAALSLFAACLVGCSEGPDVVAASTPGSGAPSPERPSGAWYAGMEQSQRIAGAVTLTDAATGSPIGGASLCQLGPGGLSCEESDPRGVAAVMGEVGKRSLLLAVHPDYVPSALTVELRQGPEVAHYSLYSAAALDAVYLAAGVVRDPSRGTVVVRTDGEGGVPEGVTVGLERALVAEPVPAAYAGQDGRVDPGLHATSSRGVAYLLNVEPGEGYEVTFGGTGIACSIAPDGGWVGHADDRLATAVDGGAVTLAGAASCMGAAP